MNLRRIEIQLSAREGHFVAQQLVPASGISRALEIPDGLGAGQAGAAVAKPARWAERETEREAAAREVGLALYRALFAEDLGDVRPVPGPGEEVVLVLRFAPGAAQLARLPWELLCNEAGDWLALHPHIQILRRVEVRAALRPAVAPVPPLRLLAVVLRQRAEVLDLDGELAVLADSIGRDIQLLCLDDPSATELRQTALAFQPHVVHILGHAGIDPHQGGRLWVKGGTELGGKALAEQLLGARELRLVVLNACRSADLQSNPSPLPTLAEGLLFAGIPAVLGMWAPISDPAARAFSGDFFLAIGLGHSLERAVAAGRRAIRALGGGPGMEWTLPVLFANSSGLALVTPVVRKSPSRRLFLAASLAALLPLPGEREPVHTAPPAPVGLRRVGDAVLLYAGERRLEEQQDTWLSKMVIHVAAQPRATMVTPVTAGDLEVVVREACQEVEPDRCGKKEAERYLLKRLQQWDGVAQPYRAKVGMALLRYHNPVVGTPVSLTVVPTSNWVERQFNRKLLVGSDAELARVADHCRAATFAAWPEQESFCFAAPGVLYLETCLICSDGQAVLLKKTSEEGSTLARIGRAWTCGTETGLDWTVMGPDGAIDWRGELEGQVRRDLGLERDQIADIRWEGVGLEVHLNVALLCTVRLTMDSATFRVHFGQAGSGYAQVQTLPLAEALAFLQQEGAHSTAALRLVLAGES